MKYRERNWKVEGKLNYVVFISSLADFLRLSYDAAMSKLEKLKNGKREKKEKREAEEEVQKAKLR
jgi:hypothetical protein